MKRILVFTRPFTNGFTKHYKECKDVEIDYISDFKFHGDFDVMRYVYEEFSSSSEEEIYSELNYSEIIMRDRFLRYIELNVSKKLINLVWGYVNSIFNKNKYYAYVGIPVDNYIIHMIIKACDKYGVKHISPVSSLLPHKARVTNLGEYIKVRDARDEEVYEAYELLANKEFKPSWLSKHKTNSEIFRLYLKERAKKIYFSFLKFKNSDPYSFHYNCIYPMQGAITVHSLDVLKTRDLFIKDLNKVIEKSKKFKQVAYLALQFNPEASINYLIADSRFSQYDLMLERVMNNIPDDMLLLVKEHPDIYGYRQLSFYEKFMGRDNVVLVDVDIPTSVVLDIASYVLVTGGASTGIEAVIKGKTVISLGGAFYGYKNNFIHEVRDFNDLSKLEKFFTPIFLTKEDKLKFTKIILDNTLDIDYNGLVRSVKKNQASSLHATKEIITYLAK